MKNKNKVYIIFGILLTAIVIAAMILIILFLDNFKHEVKILTEKNSFASTYFDQEQVKIVPDSELEDYKTELDKNDVINFQYNNINEEEIEVVSSTQNSKSIIIPEKIEDKTVTAISLDKFSNKDYIYIPSTVKTINGSFYTRTNIAMYYPIAMSLFALTIYIIALCFSKQKKLEDNFTSFPIYIISIIYLITTLILGMLEKTFVLYRYTYYFAFAISTSIYVLLIIMFQLYKKKIISNDENIKKSGAFINDAISIIKYLDRKNLDKVLAKKLDQLEEKIKYSDPISSENTTLLEKEIIENLKSLKQENINLENIEKLELLLQQRNDICKMNK